MNVVKKHVISQFLTILITVFILSCFWEFILEGIILTSGSKDKEDAEEKWEFVITSFVLAFLALIYPMFKLYRSLNKIEESNQSLETVIEQRTNNLLIKYEELKTSNLAKTEFLSRMNHELRTPINAILGFTQLLQMDTKQPLSDYQLENLEMIHSSGNLLLELIDEILDLSRIESGNIKLSNEVIDLDLELEKVIKISQPLTDKKNVSINFLKKKGHSYKVNGDSIRLIQVFSNIISNAIRYNTLNGTVDISTEDRGDEIVRIGFRDTGRGIAQENINKIFQPFDRFDVDSEKIDGVGVGLTISKQLIELMNGKIGVESSLGEGSFFYIDMPLFNTAIASFLSNEVNKKEQLTMGEYAKKKILYIEDMESNLKLVESIMLNREQIELVTATNGLDGIEIARTQIPDLILLDIHLPGLSGLEIFKNLEGIKETHGIPVIALSADAMDDNIDIALEMGFASYITKPIRVPEFLIIIDNTLQA